MRTFRQGIVDWSQSSRVQRRVLLGITWGILTLGASLASPARVPAVVAPAAARKAAPDFNLTDASGAPVRLADLKGRVVMLDFWATWCHGCKLEIPWFMEFEREYRAKGLTVIGVSMDDDGWKSVKPFIAAKKMNYTVVIGNDALAKQYGLAGMPMTVLIDKQGRIADSHSGVVDKSQWQSEIQSFLAETNKAPAS